MGYQVFCGSGIVPMWKKAHRLSTGGVRYITWLEEGLVWGWRKGSKFKRNGHLSRGACESTSMSLTNQTLYYGFIGVPSNSYGDVPTPSTSMWAYLGKGSLGNDLIDDQAKMNSLRWVLIQYDWCFKKGEFGVMHAGGVSHEDEGRGQVQFQQATLLKVASKPPEARGRPGAECPSQPSAGTKPGNTLVLDLQPP